MRSTRAWLASLGAGGSLVAAAACSLLAVSAVVAFRSGWPGVRPASSGPTLTVAAHEVAAGSRAGLGAQPLIVSASAAGRPGGIQSFAAGGGPGGSVGTQLGPGARELGIPTRGSVSGGAQAIPASSGGSGSGQSPRPSTTPADTGQTVSSTGSRVGQAVSGAGTAVGGAVSGVSPTVGQAVQQSAQSAGQTVGGAGKAAGSAISHVAGGR
jgi:hypothetical protein